MCKQDHKNKKLVITKFSFFCKRETQIFVFQQIGLHEAIFSANDFLHPTKFFQALRNFKDFVY